MIVCPDTKKEVSEETCRENRRVYREFNGRFNKPCASCGVVLPPRPKAVNAGPGNPAAAQPGLAVAPGARSAPKRPAGGAAGPAGMPGRTPAKTPLDQTARRSAEPAPAGTPASKRTRGKPPKCKCSVCFIAHCPNRREPRQFSRVPRLCTSCGQKHYRKGDQCRICARKGRQGRVAP